MRTLLFILLSVLSSTVIATPLKVATSFTVIADMAKNVGGDYVEVISITKPNAEIHNYKPTPKDLSRAYGSDLLLYNGFGLELWFEKFIKQLGDIPSVVVSDGVEPISIYGGQYDGKPNPHAWLSMSTAQNYIRNIARAFADLDPINAEHYQLNASNYIAELEAVFEPLKARIDALDEDRRWLVSSEGAFSYLARDLGLKELYLWPINADQQGTPKQVKTVIDLVRKHKISSIFSESTISDAPAKQVALETGAAYGGVLYVDSLSDQAGPVPSFLSMLQLTTTTVVEAIEGE